MSRDDRYLRSSFVYSHCDGLSGSMGDLPYEPFVGVEGGTDEQCQYVEEEEDHETELNEDGLRRAAIHRRAMDDAEPDESHSSLRRDDQQSEVSSAFREEEEGDEDAQYATAYASLLEIFDEHCTLVDRQARARRDALGLRLVTHQQAVAAGPTNGDCVAFTRLASDAFDGDARLRAVRSLLAEIDERGASLQPMATALLTAHISAMFTLRAQVLSARRIRSGMH